jgi:glycosyltransferase involved in cell wall biosynthesis
MTNSVAMGGMEEHVVLLSRMLDRARFEVYAISPSWGPTVLLSRRLADAADHAAIVTPDRRHGLMREIGEAFKLHRTVRRWRIDVAHLHSTTFQGHLVAAVVLRLAGVRHIHVTEHLAPDAPLSPVRGLLRRLFGRVVDGIVCVSDKNYRARAAHIPTPPDRSVIVVNGIDADHVASIDPADVAAAQAELGLPEGSVVVGTVVRFEPEKGLDDLVAAFATVAASRTDVELVMVGDGSLRDELRDQAARLGVGDRVHFTGFRSDPRPFLSIIDVFVLPVPVGSMSIGLLEAMALECAVVITFGGPGEAVIDGENGYWSPPRDPVALAERIRRLVDDAELRSRFGAAARRAVDTTFSARRVADRLGRLYEVGIRDMDHPAP